MDMKSKSVLDECKWFPEKIITTDVIHPIKNYVIVILNRTILTPPNIVKHLWQNADYRITVDGGTNRWLTFLNKYCKDTEMNCPDLITGDFDSITEDALKYFDDTKCRKIRTPDQNETDFTKALKILKPIVATKNLNTIIVLHETSGRLDQIMANINTLFKAYKIIDNLRLYLMSSNSLTWLINPGKHSIAIPSDLVEKERWCALIPIGEKSVVTTNGFKWNLDNHTLEFGGIVSTSNTYANEVLKINTSGFLLWTMGVFNFHDD